MSHAAVMAASPPSERAGDIHREETGGSTAVMVRHAAAEVTGALMSDLKEPNVWTEDASVQSRGESHFKPLHSDLN